VSCQYNDLCVAVCNRLQGIVGKTESSFAEGANFDRGSPAHGPANWCLPVAGELRFVGGSFVKTIRRQKSIASGKSNILDADSIAPDWNNSPVRVLKPTWTLRRVQK